MFDNLLCVSHQHNLWLVLLAAGVCMTATATALRMMLMGASPRGAKGDVLLVFAGAVGGAGAWATHFIAMLAFDPGVATGYDALGTTLSLTIALAFAILGVFAAARLAGRARIVAWGVIFTSGVGGLHYSGMLAFQVQGTLGWHVQYIVASLVIGAALSMLSLRLLKGEGELRSLALATLVLTLAICALHFTGMAGLIVTPDPRIAVPQGALPRDGMALLVGGLTTLIAAAALITLWVATRTRSYALRLLQAAFDATPHDLSYFDAEDRLVFGNRRYHQYRAALGLTGGVGMTYSEILRQALEKGAIASAVGREAEWAETVLRDRRKPCSVREQLMSDGRTLQVSNNRTADGGLVTCSMDITDLKRHAQELTTARDAAEAADRAKSDFLANMSHELRTPLNGVVTVAEILGREALTGRQAELVGIIRSSGSTLDRLLGDLLDISRLEAGSVEIAVERFNLAGITGEVFALLAPGATEKGLCLAKRFGPGTDTDFIGDGARIKQIVTNLLSNAIKFTSAGEVGLSVVLEDGVARIAVCDTGIGFDTSDKERLFGRFEQADGSITRRFGGAGLGLSISRQLAERMGGGLVAEPGAEGGSVFTLTLPLTCAPVEPALQAGLAMADGAGGPVGPRVVLIVDDNAINQRVLSAMLETTGIQVRLAGNGQEALELWQAEAFDAILMDIQMPVMDGLAAVRAIRAVEAGTGRPRTPILMVSANAFPDQVAASHAAGADGHLAKPISVDGLFSTLERLVGADGQMEVADVA